MSRRGSIFYLCIILCYAPITKASNGPLNVRVSDAVTILFSQLEEGEKTEAIEKLESVLLALNKKQQRYKNSADFVEYLYYFTHRKLLKKYDQYASISATLKTGEYDCLTATTLYSIILTELAIPHDVIETNYHIYILVNPNSEKEILLEATDPNNGFVSRTHEIEEYKSKYRESSFKIEANQVDLGIIVERKLRDKELIGLLFYNQSVNEINNGNWELANALAKKAIVYYPNIRVTRLIEYIDTSYQSASL